MVAEAAEEVAQVEVVTREVGQYIESLLTMILLMFCCVATTAGELLHASTTFIVIVVSFIYLVNLDCVFVVDWQFLVARRLYAETTPNFCLATPPAPCHELLP